MRIDLKYRKVCKDCKGEGKVFIEERDSGTGYNETYKCKLCNGKGYTEETLVFPEDGNLDVEGKGMFTLCREHWGYKVIYWESGESEDVSESLNPQSIHIIEEKECPECEGTGKHNPDWYNKALNYMPHHPITHQNCNGTGKIEKETSFTVFEKSQEEYDTEIIEDWIKDTKPIDQDKIRYLKDLNSEQETK